jgi:Tol biopolymer transport system component
MNRSVFLVVTFIILAQACNVSPERKPKVPSAALSASTLRITDLRKVRTANALPLSLSPDGQWLFAFGSAGVCVLRVETLTEKYCTEWNGHAAVTNLGWSPDGKHIAFSEYAQRYFEESDIWVMDTDPSKITDLTDDGVAGYAHIGQELFDSSPAYSPDGKNIIFARTDGQDRRTTSIYRMQNNGAPEKLATVDTEYPLSLYWKMFWSEDGKKIFYTLVRPTLDDPENGVWIVDSDGQNAQHLLGVSQTLGVPILLAVTPKADKTLILYRDREGRIPGRDSLVLLDIKTGTSETVILAMPQTDETLSPRAATFSPDGSKILYIYYNRSIGEQQVAVRDVSGDHGTILVNPEQLFGTQGEGLMELDWAVNDTIFASTMPNTGMLFHIGK